MADRVMPKRFYLGTNHMGAMITPMGQWEAWKQSPEDENPTGRRTIMGYVIPDWQRDLVWTEAQMISFMESAWKGIPIGTYSYNRGEFGTKYDNLLIDGQQRMYALQCYLEDKFPVLGYRWSEVTPLDQRMFKTGVHFGCYVTETNDEEFLRNYYNLMNFGGTAHNEGEQA